MDFLNEYENKGLLITIYWFHKHLQYIAKIGSNLFIYDKDLNSLYSKANGFERVKKLPFDSNGPYPAA